MEYLKQAATDLPNGFTLYVTPSGIMILWRDVFRKLEREVLWEIIENCRVNPIKAEIDSMVSTLKSVGL